MDPITKLVTSKSGIYLSLFVESLGEDLLSQHGFAIKDNEFEMIGIRMCKFIIHKAKRGIFGSKDYYRYQIRVEVHSDDSILIVIDDCKSKASEQNTLLKWSALKSAIIEFAEIFIEENQDLPGSPTTIKVVSEANLKRWSTENKVKPMLP